MKKTFFKKRPRYAYSLALLTPHPPALFESGLLPKVNIRMALHPLKYSLVKAIETSACQMFDSFEVKPTGGLSQIEQSMLAGTLVLIFAPLSRSFGRQVSNVD